MLLENPGIAVSQLPSPALLMQKLVNANISPFGRSIVYLSLCHVDNHIQKFNREEWIAHRDFTPITKLDDNCLNELVTIGVSAAE